MAKRVSSLDSRKRVRRTFGHLSEVAQMPNLIDVQRSSYDQFLQLGVAKADRTSIGLQEAFQPQRGLEVEMVRWFVEQQDVGVRQQQRAQRDAHLPST